MNKINVTKVYTIKKNIELGKQAVRRRAAKDCLLKFFAKENSAGRCERALMANLSELYEE